MYSLFQGWLKWHSFLERQGHLYLWTNGQLAYFGLISMATRHFDFFLKNYLLAHLQPCYLEPESASEPLLRSIKV